jgi:hypothetical protein
MRNSMTYSLLLIVLCASFIASFGQVNPNIDRQAVLRNDSIGVTYVFDRSKKNDHNRTEITYLGNLRAKDGRVFEILISRWYWGLAPRATSRIVVYNEQNQYMGNYYVGMTYDLPTKIDDNDLVFENKGRKDCDPKIVTRISFARGLPKQFFIECKNKMGDIYSFEDE